MPKGASRFPDLRLERLTKLIERFTAPPSLALMNLFGSTNAESDQIRWESQQGNRGMTPFVAPGAEAPTTAPPGIGEHRASPAFWKEKIPYGEEFLNNLRRPGTLDTYMPAQRRLAKDMQMLRSRCDRRKEWMFAQMITAGSVAYINPHGVRASWNYSIPSAQIVSLASSRHWDTGSSRNILEDIMDAKLVLKNSIGATIDYALFTSELLKYMILDTGIQTILAKSAFGSGDLFARPVQVLGSLLDIQNMVVYDEQYQIKAWLTAVVTGTSTTAVSVDDASDFVAGETLRFHDISAGTYEDETIASVDVDAGTVTVETAPSVSFKSGEDVVTMTKKFLPTKKFCMFASSVEGQKIAEFMASPFSIPRQWGMKVDSYEEWDPEVVWIRVQNKGLPVLYQEDAIYNLTVMD
jgi:hypothetical protein